MENKQKEDMTESRYTLKTRIEKEMQKAQLMPSTGYGTTTIHWYNCEIVNVEVTKSVKLEGE